MGCSPRMGGGVDLGLDLGARRGSKLRPEGKNGARSAAGWCRGRDGEEGTLDWRRRLSDSGPLSASASASLFGCEREGCSAPRDRMRTAAWRGLDRLSDDMSTTVDRDLARRCFVGVLVRHWSSSSSNRESSSRERDGCVWLVSRPPRLCWGVEVMGRSLEARKLLVLTSSSMIAGTGLRRMRNSAVGRVERARRCEVVGPIEYDLPCAGEWRAAEGGEAVRKGCDMYAVDAGETGTQAWVDPNEVSPLLRLVCEPTANGLEAVEKLMRLRSGDDMNTSETGRG